MSQHESPHQQPYSFGRDRHHGAAERYTDDHSGVGAHYERQSDSVDPHTQAARGDMIPPPPAGHRSLFTVVVLYFVTGFMLVFTGAGVGVTVEAATGEGGGDLLVNVFMLVASLAIAASLVAWLIRIHRRRATYQRILDDLYAQRFGHHPDQI